MSDFVYHYCAVDPSIDGACKINEDDDTSCITRDHPDCADRICLTYRGSTPFCSVPCGSVDDPGCPSGGFCAQFLDEYYCVSPKLN